MLKAVIFDMDGVIIDSEPMHARAAQLALKNYNIDITDDYKDQFIGSTTYYMCQKMIADFNINATPEELLKENADMKKYLLQIEGHTVVPHIIDLIKDLYQNGIKLSIASSSSPAEIEEVMDSLDIRQYFNDYVSGSSVPRPKPAPDIFLEAANRLNVKPEECYVIEDSYNGVTAACEAGITCIGFRNPNSGNQDLSKAALLIEGFEEVDYEFLSNFHNEINNSKIILSTDRFIIRELTEEDIPELFQIYQQPEVRKQLNDFTDDLETELKKHKAYIQNIYRYYGFGLWGVFLKENGVLIGRCGIEYKMLDDHKIYELSYLINSEYQGKGYAGSFVKDVIDYCFNRLDISCIMAIINTTNDKSIRLAERVGMNKEGTYIRDNQRYYLYKIVNNQL